jgi:hypothetical protein
MVDNICQVIQCNSLKIWNGFACICDSNIYITASNGTCQPKCANSQQWSPIAQSCINICGLNMRFDTQQQKCVCIDGFAFGQAI